MAKKTMKRVIIDMRTWDTYLVPEECPTGDTDSFYDWCDKYGGSEKFHKKSDGDGMGITLVEKVGVDK